jgi:hypothetical protein
LHIALFIASIFSAYRWGDWRNWEKYYSTILYFGFLDLIQNCVYHGMPLWTHVCTIGFKLPHTIINLIWILIIYTSTILIFVYHFPKVFKNQVFYISLWVLGYTMVEWILYLNKAIEYHNDWTILASLLFNCGMFIILWVHYTKPVVAWLLTILMFLVFVSIYQVPMKAIR